MNIFLFQSRYNLRKTNNTNNNRSPGAVNLQLTHSPNLLLHSQIRQNLLTPTPNNHNPNIPTNLFNSRPPSILRIPQPTHNLLRLPIHHLQRPPRQHLQIGKSAAQPCIRAVSFGRFGRVDKLLHPGVCGVEVAAHGAEFGSDYLVFDELFAEGFAGCGVDVGVFEADSGHAEGGAGEPEAFVVEVCEVFRFENCIVVDGVVCLLFMMMWKPLFSSPRRLDTGTWTLSNSIYVEPKTGIK